MRLDFLHNYPCNQKENIFLGTIDYPNPSIFIPKENIKTKVESVFNADFSTSFGCDFWGFLGILNFFSHFKIAYCIANHQQLVTGAKYLGLYELKLCKNTGMLDFSSLKEAVANKCRVFVIPSINQDIFSINDIENIFEFLKQKLEDFVLIVDISLSVSLGMRPKIWDERIVFLLNGEALGLSRNNGILLSKKSFDIPFVLAQSGLYESFMRALENQEKIKLFDKKRFFALLKEELKEDIGLFVALKYGAPNTLALRFFGIKARLMLQDLFIKGVYGVNGQECLFGLFQPSYVLQAMGYTQTQSRELLSVSIKDLSNEDFIIQALCSSYKQIKMLGC